MSDLFPEKKPERKPGETFEHDAVFWVVRSRKVPGRLDVRFKCSCSSQSDIHATPCGEGDCETPVHVTGWARPGKKGAARAICPALVALVLNMDPTMPRAEVYRFALGNQAA